MMNSKNRNPVTYHQAGVNIDAGNELINKIQTLNSKPTRPEVIGGLGGFASLFELNTQKYKQPILVAGTDGVGTKIKLAINHNRHDTIGIDLVAMCVNDIIVQGAEPLFFLDYFATSKLDVAVAEQVIQGIIVGCNQANCALVGGETAEMPGMYKPKDYDLAGFGVGVVEKENIIDGKKIKAGDKLIALPSSGFHANGFSLINKIIEINQLEDKIKTITFNKKSLLDYLLTPTRIYVAPLLQLFKKIQVNGVCHITGGGITENLPRVLPHQTSAIIDFTSANWQLPQPLKWLQEIGNFSDEEMLRTFNCGIGMIVIVCQDDTNATIEQLKNCGEQPFEIGHLEQNSNNEVANVKYFKLPSKL